MRTILPRTTATSHQGCRTRKTRWQDSSYGQTAANAAVKHVEWQHASFCRSRGRGSNSGLAPSFKTTISSNSNDWKKGVDEATLLALESPAQAPAPDLAIVTVGLPLERYFETIIDEAFERTRAQTLVGVVGAGVIGGGKERELQPCVAIAAGNLPEGSEVAPFTFSGDLEDPRQHRETERLLRASKACLLGDPFSPITNAASLVDGWLPSQPVVGGLSCPASQERPSLAIRTKGTTLSTPPGTVCGLAFRGANLEMHALTAQGAAATGPVHAVTKTSAKHLIQELDGRPAIESLRETLSKTLQKDSRVAELLKNALLIGLRPRGGDDAFLVRQVRGAGSDGSLLIGDDSISDETECRFMVRDDVAARRIWTIQSRDIHWRRCSKVLEGRCYRSCLRAAGAARACSGRTASIPQAIMAATDEAPCVVANGELQFFANGELGPVGARISDGEDRIPTYLHGFTATCGVLVDTHR